MEKLADTLAWHGHTSAQADLVGTYEKSGVQLFSDLVQGITLIEIDQPCTGPDFFRLELNVHEPVDNSDIGHRV